MKIKIFSLLERIYKKLVVLLVIFITLASIIWYIRLEEKNNAFIISIIYALSLFGLSVYLDYMNRIVYEKYYTIKEHYRYLRWIKGLLDIFDKKEKNYKELNFTIIKLQVFTLRTEKSARRLNFKLSKFDRPQLAGNLDISKFIIIDDKFTKIENEYIKFYNKLRYELEEYINQYIEENKIIKKNILSNDYQMETIKNSTKEWIKDLFILGEPESIKFEKYISGFFLENKNKIIELDSRKNKINKKYISFRKKLIKNINQIEKIYGRRINVDYKNTDLYLTEIDTIKDIIKEINDTIMEIQDNYNAEGDISDIIHNIDILKEKTNSIEELIIDNIG